MEWSNGCEWDRISVTESDGTQLHSLCGHSTENFEVTSTGNLLHVYFYADRRKEGSGFLATWREVDEAPIKTRAPSRYLLTHPNVLRVNSDENFCIQLINDSSALVSIEAFPVREAEGTPWKF